MSTDSRPRLECHISGEWQSGAGDELALINPATGEVLRRYRGAAPQQGIAAIASARHALAGLARTSIRERGLLLRRLAHELDACRPQLADLLTLEVGKPIAQARDEVRWAIEYIQYVAEWDRRVEGEIVPSDRADEMIELLRVPVGVVAAICPWNFPLALFARKVAPALLTGNAVVLKPSELTPLATVRAVQAAEAVWGDLLPGALSLLLGDGAVGARLARSPDVDMVTFTGHRDTGKRIATAAAANLTRVSLELGGKAPVIIAPDADLDLAVEATVQARHANTGQVCTCAERIFVDHAVYDAYVSAYVERVRQLRVGDPYADVDLGPIVSSRQLDKVASAVSAAVDEGATLVTGGPGAPGAGLPPGGNWFRPAVLTGVNQQMGVMREETFGPVTPIMRCASVDEALEHANDSRYGLSAYLFSNEYRTVMRATRALASGEIYVNRTSGESVQAHHSGHRESGLGGEDGKHGVLKYTQIKTVYLRY